MDCGQFVPFSTKMDSVSEHPGPVDDSVLYEQGRHVSSAVWDGQERGVLRCHEHTAKIDKWFLTKKQVELVQKAGFGYLRSVPSMVIDNSLISALVERWRRETNTFHLTVGEMTVTLEDVAFILGLTINGKPVTGITYTTCDSMCMKFLGKAPGPEHSKGGMVKLTWLVEAFSNCQEDAPMEHIEQCTRAFLLYLVGSTIFCTTSGNTVPVMYLQLFEKIDEIKSYAWGAAALSFLYRALGNASLKGQSTISGSLTLLQCWSYEHLKIGRPNLVLDAPYCFPLALKWKGRRIFTSHNHDLAFYRKALDYLDPSDVSWLPYATTDDMIVPEDLKQNISIGRSNTILICFDKAERHLPQRCLRQYGMQQAIPENVKPWERKSRGIDDNIDLSKKMQKEINEWLDRGQHVIHGNLQNHSDEAYMQWYLTITRKFIGRPKPLSLEFDKMRCGLKEIACIVNDFSTEGMNSQQMQLILKIKEVLHGCLEDSNEFTTQTTAQNTTGNRSKRKKQEKGSGRGQVGGGGSDNVNMEQLTGMQREVGMQVRMVSNSINTVDHVQGLIEGMQDEVGMQAGVFSNSLDSMDCAQGLIEGITDMGQAEGNNEGWNVKDQEDMTSEATGMQGDVEMHAKGVSVSIDTTEHLQELIEATADNGLGEGRIEGGSVTAQEGITSKATGMLGEVETQVRGQSKSISTMEHVKWLIEARGDNGQPEGKNKGENAMGLEGMTSEATGMEAEAEMPVRQLSKSIGTMEHVQRLIEARDDEGRAKGKTVGGNIKVQEGKTSEASGLEIQAEGSLTSINDEKCSGKATEAMDLVVLIDCPLDTMKEKDTVTRLNEIENEVAKVGKVEEASHLDVLVKDASEAMDISIATLTENELPSLIPSALPPLIVIPISWPINDNVTIDWIQGLMSTFDWSSQNLDPSKFSCVLPVSVLDRLVAHASSMLHKEPNCVNIENCGRDSRVVVVGDVHGQLHDLLFLLHDAGCPSENQFYVFIGNYVDLGAWGLESFLVLLAWKVFLPHRVFLLRGNHESKLCTSVYGFEKEVMVKYGNQGRHVYRKFLDCFKELPLASIIAGRVYAAHGGLFREVSVKPSRKYRGKKKRKIDVNLESNTLSIGSLEELSKARRLVLNPPSEGLNLIPGDVLWSDPSRSPGILPNKERGIGLLWGPDCTEDFLKKFQLKLIIRSHEGPDTRKKRPDLANINGGYAIDHVVESGQLITLFSAPDYPQFQVSSCS
ncbi:uncharacterized protein LOC131156465 isoform X2 [Malania oleifera]|uniref:uncharacterized protein LOC131156465 isoform X2 n=1 Tax=Malania oleifera TaxID=397392 RepID=UPI0025AE0E14|nr:uncharacterized protein LOC131156465 isoform X2 [Malania oleifera]